MLSSLLEVDLLKRVIGLQCQGAFDKRNPRDMVALVNAICNSRPNRRSRKRANRPGAALSANLPR